MCKGSDASRSLLLFDEKRERAVAAARAQGGSCRCSPSAGRGGRALRHGKAWSTRINNSGAHALVGLAATYLFAVAGDSVVAVGGDGVAAEAAVDAVAGVVAS